MPVSLGGSRSESSADGLRDVADGVDGLTVIAAASGKDGPEPTSATGRADARHAP
jgi:hypothetical protein